MVTDAQTRSRLIPLQWVYKTKRDGSKKARLVVVGCAQHPGVDFDQTHCSTLKATSLRFLAATAAIQGLHILRFDFVSAFLQSDLEPGEQIACRPPSGYETLGDDGNHEIWRVLKPIYGMQQGTRCWPPPAALAISVVPGSRLSPVRSRQLRLFNDYHR
jgi:hypothetical protein